MFLTFVVLLTFCARHGKERLDWRFQERAGEVKQDGLWLCLTAASGKRGIQLRLLLCDDLS